jgi:hypothetical protein
MKYGKFINSLCDRKFRAHFFINERVEKRSRTAARKERLWKDSRDRA